MFLFATQGVQTGTPFYTIRDVFAALVLQCSAFLQTDR